MPSPFDTAQSTNTMPSGALKLKGDAYKEGAKRPAAWDEAQSPDEKAQNPAYFQRKGETMLWNYYNGWSAVSYVQASDFYTYRLYADGNQPIIKYRDQLSLEMGPDKQRMVADNISWDIESPMPKMLAYIEGLFESIDYAVSCDCMDEQSQDKKHKEALKLLAETIDADFYERYYQMIGVKPEQRNIPFQPKNAQDVALLHDIGTFKLACEIVLERRIRKSLSDSEWKNLKRQLVRDACRLGVVWVKDYNDPVTNEPKVRYVDPQYMIAYSNISNSFENLSEAAEVVFYTIESLRAGGVEDKDLWKCVKANQGMWGNGNLNQYGASNYDGMNWNTWGYQLGSWRIPVLDGECESLSVDAYELIRDVQNQSPIGVRKLNTPTEDVPEGNKKINSYKKWYRFKWVINTDVVFDYGYQYNQVYDQDNKPRSSYSGYRTAQKSMVAQCISTLDDIQLAVLKLRGEVARARPSGLKIELNSLSEMSIGDQKFQPFEMIRIAQRTGNLIYKGMVGPSGQPLQGASQQPIEDWKGTDIGEFQKWMIIINDGVSRLETYTGINRVSSGSSPNPGDLVRTTEIAEAGTQNVLKPLLSAIQSVKSYSCRKLALRHQLNAKMKVLRYDGVDRKNEPNFDDAVLYEMGSVTAANFDIVIDALIDDKTIAKIEQRVQLSLAASKQGMPGITMSEAFMIDRILATGQLKYAELYLAQKEQEAEDRKQAAADRMQQMNTQGTLQLEQMKQQTLQLQQQGEAGSIKMQLGADIQKLVTDYNLALRNDQILQAQKIQQQFMADMKLMIKEYEGKVALEEAKPDTKVAA